MKIVLDTNVFVSSFFGGNPRRIIDLWKTGEVILCLTPPVIEEYVAVLERLGLAGEPELEELLSLFARGNNVLFSSKTPKLAVVQADPADDKFIECAAAHKAEYIVTGDKTLLAIGAYMRIKIVNPADFLKLLG